MAAPSGSPRFLTLAEVAEILNTSQAQVYALVRRDELRAIKIGGRGQWRVETTQLEAFIQRMYEQRDAEVASGTADGPDGTASTVTTGTVDTGTVDAGTDPR